MSKRNKNIALGALVAIVIGIAVALVVSQKKTTLSADSKDFKIEDTASIYAIKISDKTGQTSLLERKSPNTWMVNKKWKAGKREVDLLLKTMRLVEVKAPMPLKARNDQIRILAANSIEVQAMDKDGDIIKTYYVGGPTPDQLGTVMLVKGAPEPMVTHLPGFNGYLTPRYPFLEREWRSSDVFNLDPSGIRQVSITYSGDPSASFVLDVKGEDFILTDPSGKRPPVKLSPRQSKGYLAGFRNINWELFPDFSKEQKDSILALTPAAIVKVKTTGGDVPTLTLYNKLADNYTKGVGIDNLDLDKLYGTYGDGSQEVFLIQFPPLVRVLKQYTDMASLAVKE
jgi:hypothetical protein